MATAPVVSDLPHPARRHLDASHAEPIYAPYHTATWRTVDARGEVRYLKAGTVGVYPGLEAERDRFLWLASRDAPVPDVLDHGSDGRIEWLLTRELPGTPATDPELLADPERTVPALAEGLRALHDIDPTGCPFDYRLAVSVAHAASRVEAGLVDPAGFHPEHRHLDPATALAALRDAVPVEERDVVVCHGDYCPPNALLRDGRVVGYLDVGELGLAERWRDLAVATWSTGWNFGPGHEQRFLDAYGCEDDPARRAAYRLLYDLEA